MVRYAPSGEDLADTAVHPRHRNRNEERLDRDDIIRSGGGVSLPELKIVRLEKEYEFSSSGKITIS